MPALDFVVSHPHSHLLPTAEPLRPAALAAAESHAARGVNAIFASQEAEAGAEDRIGGKGAGPPAVLWTNETVALLEATLAQIPKLATERGLLESLRLSVANREASVRVEGLRRMWEDRVAEVEASPASARTSEPWRSCESWIDVGGKAACSVDEFWAIVGESQRAEVLPIVLPTEYVPRPAWPSRSGRSPSRR